MQAKLMGNHRLLKLKIQPISIVIAGMCTMAWFTVLYMNFPYPVDGTRYAPGPLYRFQASTLVYALLRAVSSDTAGNLKGFQFLNP
jgi:hypothetical protein